MLGQINWPEQFWNLAQGITEFKCCRLCWLSKNITFKSEIIKYNGIVMQIVKGNNTNAYIVTKACIVSVLQQFGSTGNIFCSVWNIIYQHGQLSYHRKWSSNLRPDSARYINTNFKHVSSLYETIIHMYLAKLGLFHSIIRNEWMYSWESTKGKEFEVEKHKALNVKCKIAL